IPNRPAKNISSLASHTTTPTLTMFGRLSVWIRVLNAGGPGGLVAVVTRGLWTVPGDHAPAGSSWAGRVALRVDLGHRAGPFWGRPNARSPRDGARSYGLPAGLREVRHQSRVRPR